MASNIENRSTLSSFLTSLDAFGYPVSLKYKREQKFKSTVGGAATVLIFMLMGGFLGMLLYRCINNETVKVESYLEKINRVKDVNRTLTLNRNNSEFSIYFGY